jgi:hypothetical protein
VKKKPKGDLDPRKKMVAEQRATAKAKKTRDNADLDEHG